MFLQVSLSLTCFTDCLAPHSLHVNFATFFTCWTCDVADMWS